MVENCSHNCESCTENCSERTKESFLEKPNEMSHIKKVIGVVSGKGGVGKSLVTSLLAVLAQRKGYKTAIMDADITGPSIPRFLPARPRRSKRMGLVSGKNRGRHKRYVA